MVRSVYIIAMMDTKGVELAFVRDRLCDVGTLSNTNESSQPSVAVGQLA